LRERELKAVSGRGYLPNLINTTWFITPKTGLWGYKCLFKNKATMSKETKTRVTGKQQPDK
jgi:hypothetical protein